MILGVSLLVVYSPNSFYKMKWTVAEKRLQCDDTLNGYGCNRSYVSYSGTCSSIPTSRWTNDALNAMVYADFLFSSVFPFGIMIFSNISIINSIIKIRIKVEYNY